MAELGGMAQEGAVLFTDDGSPVARANLLRQALLYSLDLGVRIMEHPEETSLTSGAQVHEGRCSAVSGMTGFPEAAEVIGVSRGIALARETGCPIHLTHLSTAGALKEVRRAKADGLAVTCDVTPHHLTLSEEDVLSSGLSGVFKVNPPLRSLADVEALWEGLWDGTVDAIATDHAPYHQDEKDLPFQEAAFGIASYECAAALVPGQVGGRLPARPPGADPGRLHLGPGPGPARLPGAPGTHRGRSAGRPDRAGPGTGSWR